MKHLSRPAGHAKSKGGQVEGQIQVSADGSTVWVHALDGSTVGRFSKRFGLDVHSTAAEQLRGAGQCIHCTHEPASAGEWDLFCQLMRQHHHITVDADLLRFPEAHL